MERCVKCEKTCCVVCGREKKISFSLPLSQKYGYWAVNPVCGDCQVALNKLATEDNKRLLPNEQPYTPCFYDIDSLSAEAAKRNGQNRQQNSDSNNGRQGLRPQLRIVPNSR